MSYVYATELKDTLVLHSWIFLQIVIFHLKISAPISGKLLYK